jgi:hypothetical protein
VARRTGAAHDRRAGQRLVDSEALDAALDRIALLRHALADLEREQSGGELVDLDQAFRWLHAHASEVAAVDLGDRSR